MTSPASAVRQRNNRGAAASSLSFLRCNRRGNRGFTLTELLVVVAIVAILAGVILIAVMSAQERANILRAKADLQAIATALRQYEADHGSLPIPPNTVNAGSNSGARTLARALLSPEDTDGVEGPGFRTVAGGKKWPAYLNTDQFRVKSLQILDVWDEPIHYLPRRSQRGRASVLLFGRSAVTVDGEQVPPLYNDADTYKMFTDGSVPAPDDMGRRSVPLATLQSRLGDTNNNNKIDNGETLRFDGRFILGGAGENRKFEKTLQGSDDIFNTEE